MKKQLISAQKQAIRRNVREAFAYLEKAKGRKYVVFEGESYFEEKTLIRALENSYQRFGNYPDSQKLRIFSGKRRSR